jgi:pseudouridine synthase
MKTLPHYYSKAKKHSNNLNFATIASPFCYHHNLTHPLKIHPMRLAKFLSQAGICSRRQAGRLIDAGLVSVDGTIAGQLTFVAGHEHIVADGQTAQFPSQFEYLIYNKPIGVDCVFDESDPSSIINHLPLPNRLFPVGRLDKDSHGLLLLTNHGDLCHRLLSPAHLHQKRYWVTVEPHHKVADLALNTSAKFIKAISNGVEIKGQITKPCVVTLLGTNRFEITLIQGLNRQIRRMALTQGYKVVDLQRVGIVNLLLGDLPVGQSRPLTATELNELMAAQGMGG